MRVVGVLLICMLACARAWAADVGPDEIVNAHFKAIADEDYNGAKGYFTDAFIRAFDSNTESLHDYYTARREQVKPGWKVVETGALADEGKQTAIVVVEFNDPRKVTPVLVSERMYYYLIRVPVKGKNAYGMAADGKAWRIDIFDALRYGTLAEARRRPYLYTKEAWPEDEGRELRGRQGLLHIQWALTQYYAANGAYPASLQGGEDKHEPLIAGGQLRGAYPVNGFGNDPMRAVEFNAASPGDFSYYSLDANGDGKPEGYWLLLHGAANSPRNYFVGFDTILIASGDASQEQTTLAAAFAQYWRTRGGAELQVTGATSARVASFSLIRPRDEEIAANWWASTHALRTWQWVIAGGTKIIPVSSPTDVQTPQPVTQDGTDLNVLTFGM